MEKKVLIQELADALASREHITKKKAENLVRAFFEIAEEALLTEHFVKIKGFGTFKMVEVSERESVNINTGERFQIGGHMKVSFTPDNYLKDLVNRPFAHFQTVVINEDTDLEELESVKDEPTPEVEMPVAEIPQPTVVEEELPTETPVLLEEETVAVAETPTEPMPEISEPEAEVVVVETKTVEPEPEAITLEPEISEPKSEVLEAEPETPEAEPEVVAAEPETPEAETEVAEPEVAVAEPEPAAEEAKDEPVAAEEEQPETVEEEIEEEIEEEPQHPRRGKTLLACLVVFLLMVLSYFVGYYRLFCPSDCLPQFGTASPADTTAQVVAEDTLVAPVSTETATTATDTLNRPDAQPLAEKPESAATQPSATPAPPQVPGLDKEAKRAATLAAAAKYKQVPDARYLIIGTRGTHTIKSGETLRIVAEQIYGSRGYASYISVHNDITDPNLIEVGMVVKLPLLERLPE